jgi:hypothetical protein
MEMKIKRTGWIPYGHEADLANQILSGNGARLYFHLYRRANRPNGRLELRYEDVAKAVGRSKRSIVDDFAELKKKGICVVDSAVNQHTLVQVEICDPYWPFAKRDLSENPDSEAQYVSQIRDLLRARACIACDFGPADEKFALDLLARGIDIEQVDRAIRLGCARKYQSLLNGMENRLIGRLSYFRELVEEVGDQDPRFWDRCVDLELKKMEDKWCRTNDAAVPNSAPARRQSEKTG